MLHCISALLQTFAKGLRQVALQSDACSDPSSTRSPCRVVKVPLLRKLGLRMSSAHLAETQPSDHGLPWKSPWTRWPGPPGAASAASSPSRREAIILVCYIMLYYSIVYYIILLLYIYIYIYRVYIYISIYLSIYLSTWSSNAFPAWR